ncbi:nbs [Leptinotarsa decemlineata]|uniref:nbs n=1 Tax=Leptinotarsa decemlineata TaxID=7539 RepID=UPI003D307C8D
MLYLLENKNDGKTFYLLNQNEFVIGRKDCDILLQNDQSISRRHAIIRIKENHATLEDCGSKYKTQYRNKEISPNEEIRLKNNDIIQFGVISSQFIFKVQNFVTSGTRLSSIHKTKLKKDIALLGGLYTDNWTSECTHLTVEEITLTVKVLHALIDQKPIVIPAYWSKYVENINKRLPPPNIEEYQNPPMAEALLNKVELKSNITRKELFKGKTFMFLKEKSKMQMEDIIKKVGGAAMSWEKTSIPLADILNSQKDFIIIQTPNQEEDTHFNKIIKNFIKKGQRTIPLQEIAMAIVHGSCDKDCNPNFNRAEEVFPTSRAIEPTQNNALVPNTESECFSEGICKIEGETRMIIPDTFDPTMEAVKIKNRKTDTSKEKTDCETVIEKDSSKRVRNETEHGNPIKKLKLEKDKSTRETGVQERNNSTIKDKAEKQNDNFISKAVTSNKRKAEQCDASENKKDDNNKPFAMLLKKSRKDPESTSRVINPFSLTKKSSKEVSQISDDNPFKSSARKPSDEETLPNIFSSTRVNDKSPEKTCNSSSIYKIENHEMNYMWISKETSRHVKNEEQYDTEMQSFIDLFKNKVIVDVMPDISIRSRKSGDVTDGAVTYGSGNNFKRFKKVRPLYPQSTIIGKENFVARFPGETTGINDTRRVIPDSDDESETRVSKKRPPKKFFI